MLFRSGKPGQFIAGADLNELGALIDASREQCQQAIVSGQALFSRVSQLPFPVVALVDGNSMGGGTELILSMDYRIASTNPATKIALPETKIGLIPGWGGTQRMTRLGWRAARHRNHLRWRGGPGHEGRADRTLLRCGFGGQAD